MPTSIPPNRHVKNVRANIIKCVRSDEGIRQATMERGEVAAATTAHGSDSDANQISLVPTLSD